MITTVSCTIIPLLLEMDGPPSHVKTEVQSWETRAGSAPRTLNKRKGCIAVDNPQAGLSLQNHPQVNDKTTNIKDCVTSLLETSPSVSACLHLSPCPGSLCIGELTLSQSQKSQRWPVILTICECSLDRLSVQRRILQLSILGRPLQRRSMADIHAKVL